jgi:hypothetical protein
VRGAAAALLVRVDPDGAAKLLPDAMRAERDPEAERRLAGAFGHYPPDRALALLEPLARDDTERRRAALAAEALGEVREASACDALLGLVGDVPHWSVMTAACLALGRHRDVRVPALMVRMLRHPDAAVRSAAHETLRGLCRIDHGADPSAWRAWWAGARKGYEFPDPDLPVERPRAEEEQPKGTTSDARRDDRPTYARFFGIELKGRRIAFVIDFSQSMWGPRREKAEQELIDAVKGLPSTHTFSVVLFNERVWRFRDRPMPARPQEKLDLSLYLREQETKSYTNIYDALELTLGQAGLGPQKVEPPPGLDELVLLSDGFPNRGRIRKTEDLLRAIREMNQGKVLIHTVSLGDDPHPLLPTLAEQNGGRYVARPFAK